MEKIGHKSNLLSQNIDRLTPVIVFSSEYDAAGRRIELASSIGGTSDFVNTYNYDNLGHMEWVKQTDQGGYAVADKRVDFAYDDASRYATISRYADLAGTDLVATATYTFDDANRLTSLIYTQPNSTGLPFYGWTYDAASRMTSMTTIDGEVDYAHDSTHQLTTADYDYATDEGYVYDENGNRVTANGSSYVTGPNNQLLSDGTYTYEYDAEGNRTLKYIDADEDEVFDAGDTDATEYAWDNRNRLTEVEHFTTYANYDAGTSDLIVEYTYDCFNRLVSRTLDSDGTSGATAVEQSVYVYEGTQIVAQFDKTGVGDLAATDLSHRYLWNPQAVDQLFSDEQVHYDGGQGDFLTDDLFWALTDQLNSVRDLAAYNAGTDETTIALHRVFDAFGNDTSSTGAAACLFGYTGKLFDEATGLQNNWNRWYDATVGKWLSEDAIWDGTNLNAYVGNNPTTNVDPLGLANLWNPLTWGMRNRTQSWWGFVNPLSDESRAVVGALPGAYLDTALSGQQASSLSGWTDSATDSVNPFGGGTHFGPAYGQNKAYATGQAVGSATGLAINTVLTVSGVRGIVTSVQAIKAAGGLLQVGELALAGGGTMRVVIVNGRVLELTPALAAQLGITVAAGSNIARAVGKPWGGADFDWKTPVQRQLEGKGQLGNLRRNPNLKNVDIECLLKKSPEELEEMARKGEISQETLRQIKKAFQGRDLGGSKGGGKGKGCK